MVIGVCEICGEEIDDEYPYYEMPNGDLVCGPDYDCILQYVDTYYFKLGGIS